MADHYDNRETRDPAEREVELFSRLGDVLRAALAAPAYAERLKGVDPRRITDRAALASLPVLRKSELACAAQGALPFGGIRRKAARLVRPAVYLAGSDLRA